MGSNHEKNAGRKSRDTLPLTNLIARNKLLIVYSKIISSTTYRDELHIKIFQPYEFAFFIALVIMFTLEHTNQTFARLTPRLWNALQQPCKQILGGPKVLLAF